MRAIVWSAVSSKPQLRGDSLEQQEADGRAIAERFGWQVVEALTVFGQSRSYIFYTEAEVEVEVYRRFRELCDKRAADVLICRGRDRLGRSDALISQVEALARQAGMQVYSMAMPSYIVEPGQAGLDRGALYSGAIERATAQAELIELKRRYSDGTRARVRRGLHPNNREPFGYRRVDKDAPMAKVPREIAVLREMYKLYVKGLGYQRITARLNSDDRWKPRRRPVWVASTVARVLHNPFYAGFVTWRDVVAVGQHEPVFMPEEWSALQAEKRRRARTRGKSAYPYTGLVRCRVCGGGMTVQSLRKHPPHDDEYYVYYRCSRGVRARVTRSGEPHYTCVPLAAIREAVLNEAHRLSNPQELEKACQDQAAEERIALRRARVGLEAALDDLAAEVHRLLDAHTRWGYIQADVFDEAMSKAARRQKEGEEALAVVIARQEELPNREERARRLMDYATDVERWLDAEDAEEANAWLAQRVRAVWCEGRGVVTIELV